MADEKLQTYLDVACELAKQGGELIRNRIWQTKQNVEAKAHRTDLVTETDKEVEELIIGGLKKKFPDHKFIGEESTASGLKVSFTDEPTWIIDPVDGTMNFVHGYPNVCVSIGLTIGKEPVLGIIYVPVPKYMFTAIKGCGTFLNGSRIQVSNVKELSEALINIETSGANLKEHREYLFQTMNNFLPIVHGIRGSGSAAFSMAMVALGGLDLYFESGIHAWDIAAGTVIIREAGGVVLDPSGKELDLMSRRMLSACNAELAAQAVEKIIQIYPTRDDA